MNTQALEENFRALELFDRIPAGHTGIMVTNRDFEPHLRPGELAVVDTADSSIQFGELYVLRMNIDSEKHLQHLSIVQLTRQTTGLWYAFSFEGKGDVVLNGRRLRYADGPLRVEYWPEKCVGRVVGYLAPRWDRRCLPRPG